MTEAPKTQNETGGNATGDRTGVEDMMRRFSSNETRLLIANMDRLLRKPEHVRLIQEALYHRAEAVSDFEEIKRRSAARRGYR